jgi:RNA polymerase sigma-70 factor, ECF subfamily
MTTGMAAHRRRVPVPMEVPAHSDEALIEAVRRDPPDQAALDVLARRQWAKLFARCRMLTQDAEAAADLAQDTWCRVLRARRRLDPLGNLSAYLAVVATNLWRDRARTARRAGSLSNDHLSSLDAVGVGEHGEHRSLADVLPDPASLDADEQALLSMDIDRALASLTPRARDVLLARYVDGESAAEIGRRYGRTEQTVTAWLRQAATQMRRQLGGHTRLTTTARASGS